jgi:hypothetical protein
MAYFATELQAPSAFQSIGARGAGVGYPVGDATKLTYWPTTIALSVTTNKSGNANSPCETGGVTTQPYGFKTWEEKAAATVPPGVFATVLNP